MKSNGDALELYNILSRIKSEEGTHREYAQAKTLRNMKLWVEAFNEKNTEIDNDNCQVDESAGKGKVLVKQILKVTKGDTTEEVPVPTYTQEGEKKRAKEKSQLKEEKLIVKFEIHSTDDDAGLNTYEKIVLEELGFLKPKPSLAKAKD